MSCLSVRAWEGSAQREEKRGTLVVLKFISDAHYKSCEQERGTLSINITFH